MLSAQYMSLPQQTFLQFWQHLRPDVSRPFLIKLLEEGKIPYHKVGKHRRVRMEDVMNYKRAIDEQREAVLDQLVAEAQEQDMGYE